MEALVSEAAQQQQKQVQWAAQQEACYALQEKLQGMREERGEREKEMSKQQRLRTEKEEQVQVQVCVLVVVNSA